jgi:hypothetical protein
MYYTAWAKKKNNPQAGANPGMSIINKSHWYKFIGFKSEHYKLHKS